MNEDLSQSGYPPHEKSIFILDSPWHILVLIANCLIPGTGTILAGFVKGGDSRWNNLQVGIFQNALIWIFLFGWVWAVYSGYQIYKISAEHIKFCNEYDSELESSEDEEAQPNQSAKPKKKGKKGKKGKLPKTVNESARKLRK